MIKYIAMDMFGFKRENEIEEKMAVDIVEFLINHFWKIESFDNQLFMSPLFTSMLEEGTQIPRISLIGKYTYQLDYYLELSNDPNYIVDVENDLRRWRQILKGDF